MSSVAVIEIANEPMIEGRPFTDKATGNTRPAINRQNAYLHSGNAYPIPFKIKVEDRDGPRRPGFYLLGGGEAFRIGQYGVDMVSSKLELVPLDAALEQLTKMKPQAVKAA